MKTKTALICYGVAGIMATWGWFNQVILLFDFIVLSIITIGVNIFNVE